ncbi:MAG: alpha/beta fold hydrolase [Anaerolineae bacterium]|nr:alpha/beta fold hydrolase [Anaerolineae bacterium]
MRRWLLRILLLLIIVIFIVPFLIPLNPTGVDPRTLASDGGQFVEVEGLDTYYVERGPDDGQPLLLVHGLGGSTFSWRDNIGPLAEAGYHVLALDRPGFGLTEKTLAFDVSAPSQADFLAAFMDARGIDHAVLIGHSAGGGIIAHFALKYPGRVDGLIFVDGALGHPSAPPIVGTLAGFAPFTRWLQIGARVYLTPERYGDMLASAYADPAFATEAVRAGYTKVLQTPNFDQALAALIRDSANNPVPLDRLSEIGMPSLLIWGREDTWVPLANGEALADALPNAELIVYEDAGHLPMEEAADQFNADVIGWLGRLGEAG